MIRKHLTVSTEMTILQVPAQIVLWSSVCYGYVLCHTTTVVLAIMYKATITATLWELSPAVPALALHCTADCTAVSNIANISIPWEYFFLVVLGFSLLLSAKTTYVVKGHIAGGDDVVKNMPAENENKDLWPITFYIKNFHWELPWLAA